MLNNYILLNYCFKAELHNHHYNFLIYVYYFTDNHDSCIEKKYVSIQNIYFFSLSDKSNALFYNLLIS